MPTNEELLAWSNEHWNEPDWWAQQSWESPLEWQARCNGRSERDSLYRDYAEYQELVDHIKSSYRADEDGTPLETRDVVKAVSSWIFDQAEMARDEKEEELKGDYDASSEEVASQEGWIAKELTAAAEEEDEVDFSFPRF